jgi:hypothetical protein
VNIFDSTSLSLIHQIPCPSAHHLSFHPMTSLLICASQLGLFCQIDVGKATVSEWAQIATNDYIAAIDVCASGNVVAVGDGVGVLYMYVDEGAQSADIVYNEFTM